MGQNERNAKSGTLVESCSLLLLTSLHFTTDIFRQKAGCVFVNILRTSSYRPPFVAATFSVFMVSQERQDYDVPMGTSVTPLGTLTAEIFFFSTLTAIAKTLFGKVSDSILIRDDLK
jgi:hypothetical protein